TDHSETWRMPARYYEVDLNEFGEGDSDKMALVGLDTNVYTEDVEQQTWLKERLNRATARWKLAFGHHPIFSYGEHGTSEELSAVLQEEFCKTIDIYFAGHDHDLQLLEGDCKTLFVISGASAKLRPTEVGPMTKFALSTLGFVYARVDNRS